MASRDEATKNLNTWTHKSGKKRFRRRLVSCCGIVANTRTKDNMFLLSSFARE
jgi:hypothetical protein